jgi:hypothetical protein
MYVYLLQHSYLIDQKKDIYETKIIGIYSSRQNAKNALETYRTISGFNQHPNDFFIDRYMVDKDNWIDGF